ncbi:glycosyl transferase [Shewanella sp. Actino-trap-3]|uniref:glycosyl transferase n=1 Tax=Shewanella sp. Actino-trap-3 TaxID=2058331 RepID=UPI0012FF5587|nr:glycosyl transferase [Shewanella sp. Actino-trap-3]
MPKIGELTLTSVDEFDFRLLIKALGKGEKGSRTLTFAEASLLLEGFAKGKATRVQMASAMMLMRVRGETTEEVAGMVAGLRHTLDTGWGTLAVDIDWPVYAGKREQLPWLLLVAKLLASQGVRVMLHGDSQALPHRRHVESCLAAVNIACCTTPQSANAALLSDNIVYVCAGDLAPVLDECRQLHQELGLRSLIQTAARCINPTNAAISLRSYFHPGLDNLHQGICEILFAKGEYHAGSVAIFKGLQGETECNPRVSTTVTVVNGQANTIVVSSLSVPTLLEGFSGAKVGQAELSSDILALLWREQQPFSVNKLTELMSRTMIEQALSSIQATLAALLLLLSRQSAAIDSINATAITAAQAVSLSQQCWANRFSTTDNPLDQWRNKEWLCAV